MNLIRNAMPYFAVPLILSLIFVPLAKKIGLSLNIYAVENSRTARFEDRRLLFVCRSPP